MSVIEFKSRRSQKALVFEGYDSYRQLIGRGGRRRSPNVISLNQYLSESRPQPTESPAPRD